ncbi:MAG: FkbM family methyltransferase [Salinivirgaceae bacterium]|nr:FkbM family methyltransferase [Salinivirgaceae bacterium]
MQALKKNEISKDSIIYIFSDGCKKINDQVQANRVIEVRNLIRKFEIGKQKVIVTNKENKGLADSIIGGVTMVLNKHGKAIVLEDDIVVSSTFLEFMNIGLNLYANDDNVFHINGYTEPLKAIKREPFFSNVSFCWGWATWQRAWKKLILDPEILKKEILDSPKRKYHFDIEGSSTFSKQIEQNISGEINTWAVKWYSTVFLNKGLCLHPIVNLANNIGKDGTGVHHTKPVGFVWKNIVSMDAPIESKKIPLKESKQARNAMRKFYTQKQGVSIIKNLLSTSLKNKIKRKLLGKVNDPYYYLDDTERYKFTQLKLEDCTIGVPDIMSFRFMFKEIFVNEIYKFYTSNEKPYIIDAGANIGLSIIFFKKMYPNAIIDGFEPDPKIFDILKDNINAFSFKDISLHNYGLWNEEKEMQFYSEGADAGRVLDGVDKSANQLIKLQSLRGFLNKKVDLLKIDIEGAEFIVLDDIRNLLKNVDRIFIEYHSFPNKSQNLNEILNILKNSGFRININTPGLVSQQPFLKVNTYQGMDMQLNIYGYRI